MLYSDFGKKIVCIARLHYSKILETGSIFSIFNNCCYGPDTKFMFHLFASYHKNLLLFNAVFFLLKTHALRLSGTLVCTSLITGVHGENVTCNRKNNH